MTRFFVIALVLAEINFRCVPTTACEDDDEQRCMEASESESEGESEGEGETEGETEAVSDLPPS